jgi:hypothetical protein
LHENFKAALSLSEDALEHIEELPRIISKVIIPGTGYNAVFLVLLSGDRLFTEADETLNVYLMSDFTSPIATYDLPGHC